MKLDRARETPHQLMSNHQTPPMKAMKKFPKDSRALVMELDPILESIEHGRQKALIKIRKGKLLLTLCVFITLLLSICYIVGVNTYISFPERYYKLVFIPILVGALVGMTIYSFFIGGHKAAYRSVYKNEVIGGMARLIHAGVNYAPTQGIPERRFKEAGLYNTNIDRYDCEDLFFGQVGKTGIMFSEIFAQEKKTRTDSDGDTQTEWITIFKGLFFIADFNKNFRSWLTIQPDFAEKNFGWFGRKIQGFSSNLIRLESPDFEKAFVVHGGDQVEARYILTPDMQERLLALRNRYGADIRLSLQNSELNLSIPNPKDWFEPNIRLPANEFSQMQTFINQMCYLFDIVEMLDLNTRIWSKE